MPASLAIVTLQWWGRRRWIPFGIRDRVLRVFVHPERVSSMPFECECLGRRYRGDLASFIDWNVCFYGGYELGVLAFLRDVAAKAGRAAVALDVGANTGQHTLLLSLHIAHVHAFEPWAQAGERLETNLKINGISNVTYHPFGLGDRHESRIFYAPRSANLGTGSFVADVNHNENAGLLPVVPGDLAVERANLDRVDLIKIDTEGFEIQVLRGLKGTLARYRPVVVFEVSPPTAQELRDEGSFLNGLCKLFGPGWRFFDMGNHPERYTLTPLDSDPKNLTNLVAVPEEISGLLARQGKWPSVPRESRRSS